MVSSSFEAFESTVYQQIVDAEELIKVFDKYRLIPVYSTDKGTSHEFTRFLYELSELSPSHQSCKKDMQTYIFGNALDIVEKTYPSLLYKADDVKDIELSKKITYATQLKEIGISLGKIIEVSKALFSDELDSGNFYLHVRIATVLGEKKKVILTPVKQLNVMYLNVPKPYVMVTEKFDESWWITKPPKIYPVSYIEQPLNLQEEANGDLTTVIHFKGNDDAKYYGRPRILTVIDCMMAEHKTLQLNSKIAATETLSKILMLFEELPPERTRSMTAEKQIEDFNKRMMSLRQITTNEGNKAHSIAAIEYPNGTTQPTTVKLDVNRDTIYAEFSLSNAASMIYSTHGWSKELTGMVQVKTGIGANILYDLFIIKNTSTVEPNQRKYEAFWGWLLGEIEVNMGLPESGLSIKFPDAVTSLVTKITDITEQKKATQLNVINDVNNKS